MATKKSVLKPVRKTVSKTAKKVTPVTVEPVSLDAEKKTSSPSFLQKLLLVILIGIAVFLVAKKFGKYIIVATVNNKPVSRWQLNKALDERYGQSTLEEIVNRNLLEQIAKRDGINVSQDEINKEVESLKTQLGDVTVADSQLKDSAAIKLLVTKVAEKKLDLSISDDEVKQYFTDNKDYFQGQKFDDIKAEIKETLYQLKLQQKFSEWFKTERENAKVMVF